MAPKQHQQRGMAVGLGVTSLCSLAFMLGWFEPFENYALDLRQLYFNHLDVDSRIAHVDYDDGTIGRVGIDDALKRDFIAALVHMLHELGARAVAIDILFLEKQNPRPREDAPALDAVEEDTPPASRPAASTSAASAPTPLAAVAAAPPSPARPDFIVPDLELARALREFGNAFLGVAPALTTAQTTPVTPHDRKLDAAAAVLRPILMEDFALIGEPLKQRWEAAMRAAGQADGVIGLHAIEARVKNDVAMTKVRSVLESRPDLWNDAAPPVDGEFDSLVDQVITRLSLSRERLSRLDRKALEDATRQTLGQLCMMRKCPPLLAAHDRLSLVPETAPPDPPYYVLAAASRGVAAVTVEKDPRDKSVHSVPVALRLGSRLIPHLGVAMAAQALDLDLGRIAQDGRTLVIPSRTGNDRRVPVDARGRMLLHWSPSDRDFASHYERHIPALALKDLSDQLAAMAQNEEQEAFRLSKVLHLTHRTGQVTRIDPATGRETVEWRHDEAGQRLPAVISEYVAAQRNLRLDVLHSDKSDAQSTAARLAELRGQLDAELARASAKIAAGLADFAKSPPADHEEEEQLRELQRLDRHAQKIGVLRAKNAEIATRLMPMMADLSSRLRGKYVFIGMTATGEDRHPTAIHADLPGVIAHSTVLNDFLQDRFIKFPPRIYEILLVLMFGTLATLITATSGLRMTVLVVTTMITGYTLVNFGVLFRLADFKVELVAPLAATMGAAVPVTFYRWWTADTQRREIRSQLGSYTSPALANRLAEDPQAGELLTRVENRDVTCFFSDLKGFTGMAEQVENPERVKNVLNIYLDAMSEILIRHRALINKFMGDGIFAFFNSTVLPLAEHPRQACEAALACLAALEKLREDQRARGGDELIQSFHMRIGLASGVAGVGDFGSTRKKDYTVIGDVANLAARLEPANKVFGTQLMVSGPTRDAVHEAFEFRYLAELQVKGKRRTVPVYELLGRKGAVPPERLEYAKRFADGVELYKQRRWDECMRHFTRMLVYDPDDVGLSAYIDACQEKKMFPPDESWAGALELKEK